ncbi:hypothetical protein ABT147_33200 [Streptomyces sp. NPDC001868]|uniref:ATP-dependent DNA ligase n=1 Tax=Streptomyces sp. NPDC001868 TaxID=3154401 RepID=UPI00331D4287
MLWPKPPRRCRLVGAGGTSRNFDGHRAVLVRDSDGVRLFSRSGRDVTAVWLDVALAGMALRPGTTVDGELVIWRGGALDWGAVQSRAASTPARARTLAAELPAS